jgi:hypothetical protein
MKRDSRYDILFEPIAIGPVKVPNCFYQVPHRSGVKFQIQPDHPVILRVQEGQGDLNDSQPARDPAKKANHRVRRADRQRPEGLPVLRRCAVDFARALQVGRFGYSQSGPFSA